MSQALSAAVAGASNYASVASNAASVASNYASIVSNYASVVSVNAANVASAVAVEAADRTSADNALSNLISALSVQLSLQISAISQAHSALSHTVSVKVPWLGGRIVIVSDTQSTNGSALVDVSGMVLTVAADETWLIEGLALISTSAAGVGIRMGLSVPPLSTPRHASFHFVTGAQSAAGGGGAGVLQVSGNSILMSQAANAAGTGNAVWIKAIFNTTSSGTVRLMVCGIASTAASPLHIMPGTMWTCYRIK
jgi:hypothetical protein